MPDLLEWLVVERVEDQANAFYDFETQEKATAFLREVIREGKKAQVYQRVPFTTRVDVTVKARRTRKQKASLAPAEPSGGPPPSGSEPPSAGENAQDGPGARTAGKLSCLGAGGDNAASTVGSGAETPLVPSFANLKPTGKEEESPKEGAERRPAPSPVSVWDCEVDRYGQDGPCAGPIIYDEVTHGRFCETHMVAAPSGRAEWHRRNGHRNRPAARVA